MATLDDKMRPVTAPDSYTQEVRNSPGARFMRGELGFQQRARERMDNIEASMRQQRAAVTPPAAAVARPVAFAGIDPEPVGMFKRPAVQASTPARAAAPPASQPNGVGAPKPAGGGSAIQPRRLDANTFTFSDGRTVAAGATTPTNTGTVNSQSFGQPNTQLPLVQRPGTGVASTFGQSVLTMPDDNRIEVQRPQGTLRGPDAMSEQYNAREDRDLRNKVLSDLDSQRFRAELVETHGGRRGAAASEQLGDIARQRAQLAAGAEQLSAGAVAARNAQNTTLANTAAEQNGANQRAAIADATDREQIAAGLVQRPALQADANGNLMSIAGTTATPVTGAGGAQFNVGRPAATGQITPAQQYDAINGQIEALMGNPPGPGEDATVYQQNLAQLAAQRDALLGGGAGGAGAKPPTEAEFLAKARAANPGVSESDLRAYYKTTYATR